MIQLSGATEQLLAEARQSLLFTAHRPDVVMERGEGMLLWDTEGRRYLDFIGGWAVTSLGHSPAVIREALAEQAAELVMASPGFYNKPQIAFAELLTSISCFDRAFFASSGAEANEGAIKLARKYGQKKLGGAYEIITMQSGFHGRTLATMAATGKPQWEQLYAPRPGGFRHVPFGDLDALRQAISGETCAVMLEPVQGEGGVHPIDAAYARGLRELCDAHGLLLIFDEIQTGIGRTGTMFAYEQYGIEPDMMTLAKGLGGGFPVSALLAKEALNLFEPGDQGGTYTGQPLAMAVGLAVVQEIIARRLPEHAANLGAYIQQGLRMLADQHGLSKIRGRGLLLAFDLPQPSGAAFVSACMDAGLLINSPQPHTIRLMPPLVATEKDADEMLAVVGDVLHGMGEQEC